MPRGGARAGAGRKPKGDGPVRDRSKRVLAMPGITLPPALRPPTTLAPPVTNSALKDPPADLEEDAKPIWQAWAPWAIEQGTLVDATVAGFRELCEQFLVKQALWSRLRTLGIASAEGDRILKRYEKIVQRIDASLKNFRLTAFGKAMDPGKSKKVEAPNPWASMSRQA